MNAPYVQHQCVLDVFLHGSQIGGRLIAVWDVSGGRHHGELLRTELLAQMVEEDSWDQ